MGHTLESTLKILTDFYIEKNQLHAVVVMDEKIEEEESQSLSKANKTLTPKTRRLVLARDNGCKYKDPQTGQVCGSKHFEQVDHKTSQWAGGNHAAVNLQVLCANHNRFKYRKETQLRWL